MSTTRDSHAPRWRSVCAAMTKDKLDALLVTHLPDVRWLTGFTGSNAAVAVTAKQATLFTDGRYTIQAKQQTRGARVSIAKHSALKEACTLLSARADTAAFDPQHTTVADLDLMRAAPDGKNSSSKIRRGFFQPLRRSLISDLRMIKDAGELATMEEAAHLGCRLFEEMVAFMQAGLTEVALAAELEYRARSLGAEGMSFETIVASGERSAMPHAHATAARLPRKGFVTLDFGVILKGYCSDMTRTVHIGRASHEEQAAYSAVLEAQQAAVAAVRPGVTCGEVDEAARGVLRKAGLARYFTHSTGHGVGLEIHESPRLAARQEKVLEPGMTITIEPGVYLPGKFGIRIEDMVAVTPTGFRVLTPVTKDWIEIHSGDARARAKQ